MFDIIDIHNHSLPLVDDGAKSVEEMKNMIDIAYNDGIKAICFTPHYKQIHFNEKKFDLALYEKNVESGFRIAQAYASEKYPSLQLFLGNEIYYHEDLIHSINNSLCRKLNNGRYILVEFDVNISEKELEKSIVLLTRKGLIPIIAHIERYTIIYQNFSLVSTLKYYGALIQVNSFSIMNARFGKTASLIKKLLKNHLVDIVASDSHDTKDLSPVLCKCSQYVTKKYGEDYAEKIFCLNQKNILNIN